MPQGISGTYWRMQRLCIRLLLFIKLKSDVNVLIKDKLDTFYIQFSIFLYNLAT